MNVSSSMNGFKNLVSKNRLMQGQSPFVVAVIIVVLIIAIIIIAALFSLTGQVVNGNECKAAGEKWDFNANNNLPSFDCCDGLKACTDGFCRVSCADEVECAPGSGACCDSSGNYRPSSYRCTYTTDYGCPWGTGSGDDVGVRYYSQYCSGNSASCNGDSFWSSWSVADYCSSSEYCSEGSSTCQSKTSDECTCGSWKDRDCGTNYCSSSYMYQTRICSPDGCAVEERCVYDSECSGTGDGICYSDSDCGLNRYIGESFCQGGDVYKEYRTYDCRYPGTSYSICEHTDTNVLIQDCGSNEVCHSGMCEVEDVPQPPATEIAAYYILDGHGVIHRPNGAVELMDAPWWDFDMAKDLEVNPNGPGYYVLDAYGAILARGGAPELTAPQWWGYDMARDFEFNIGGIGYYVLDKNGQLHPGGGAPALEGYAANGNARDIEFNRYGPGYWILDAYGTIHTFGGATDPTDEPTFSEGVARDLELNPSGAGYYVLDGYGNIYARSGAPEIADDIPHWNWDIARDMAFTPYRE